jgi:hypothetical protein
VRNAYKIKFGNLKKSLKRPGLRKYNVKIWPGFE